MTVGTVQPWLVYTIALGAASSGVTGIANNASLGRLQDISREEVRVAESRGRMEAKILRLELEIARMMPREGILELHKSQQMLIEELIRFTTKADKRYGTKAEIQLLLSKIQGKD